MAGVAERGLESASGSGNAGSLAELTEDADAEARGLEEKEDQSALPHDLSVSMCGEPNQPNLLSDEEGMTLVEILTALVILTMVTSILFSFLFMGISMYKRIQAESQIRNHGDAIVSQIISELKDAVYVSQGTSSNEINFVKRALTASGEFDGEAYVQSYRMRIEPIGETNRYGIGLYDLAGGQEKMIKRYDLPSPFSLEQADSDQGAGSYESTKQALTAVSNQLVEVHLLYEKITGDSAAAPIADASNYEILTRIPLFRSD